MTKTTTIHASIAFQRLTRLLLTSAVAATLASSAGAASWPSDSDLPGRAEPPCWPGRPEPVRPQPTVPLPLPVPRPSLQLAYSFEEPFESSGLPPFLREPIIPNLPWLLHDLVRKLPPKPVAFLLQPSTNPRPTNPEPCFPLPGDSGEGEWIPGLAPRSPAHPPVFRF